MTSVLAFVVVLAWLGLPPWQAIGMSIGAAVMWVADVLVRPWRPCHACGGSGRHGLSSARAFGACWACHGERVHRFGARMVRRATGRKEP